MDRPLNILVACEFSGRVRDAFTQLGHNAVSCDLEPTETFGYHYLGNMFDIAYDPSWDLIIAHPPCTHLAVSGSRWWKSKPKEWQEDALAFVQEILDLPCRYIALENPVGASSSHIRKPDQYIQPWQFGHGETKKTGLWLKNLPLLTPTEIVSGRFPRVHLEPPGPNQKRNRNLTYLGIASAMADQWGRYIMSMEDTSNLLSFPTTVQAA